MAVPIASDRGPLSHAHSTDDYCAFLRGADSLNDGWAVAGGKHHGRYGRPRQCNDMAQPSTPAQAGPLRRGVAIAPHPTIPIAAKAPPMTKLLATLVAGFFAAGAFAQAPAAAPAAASAPAKAEAKKEEKKEEKKVAKKSTKKEAAAKDEKKEEKK